jgi:aryl-alcohol dehydrogenase-like predicted oxidoreductase
MRLRALGKSLFNVSELSLGTWGLSGDGYGPVPEAEQDKVIDRAVALGVTLFETSDAYANGAMEARLGQRLPPGVFVATKRDVVDVVLLHNPVASTLTGGEATGVLANLKERGQIRAWGVSAGSAEVARAALAAGADVISLTYHVFASAELLGLHDEIAAKGVGVLAHSVLSHGLLTGYWSLHKEFVPGDHRSDRWTPDELRRRVQQLSAMRPLVGGPVHTMRAAAMRFALACPDVSSIVLGPRNTIQLDQLLREGNQAPPYHTEDQLKSLAFRLQQVGVTT